MYHFHLLIRLFLFAAGRGFKELGNNSTKYHSSPEKPTPTSSLFSCNFCPPNHHPPPFNPFLLPQIILKILDRSINKCIKIQKLLCPALTANQVDNRHPRFSGCILKNHMNTDGNFYCRACMPKNNRIFTKTNTFI